MDKHVEIPASPLYVGLIMLLVIITLGSIVGVKAAQLSIQRANENNRGGPPPETVATDTVKELKWERKLSAIGSLAAAKGVAVSCDVPGVVSKIHFDSGAMVSAGAALLELDTRVERAQLKSAQVRRKLAVLNASRSRTLANSDAISRAQLDADTTQLEAADSDIAALITLIERKTVRAPFAGRLGMRAVNLGQYVGPGSPVTTLESLDSLYVDFSLPQRWIGEVATGLAITVAIQGIEGVRDGTIAAIEPQVDSTTRALKLRATVSNRDDLLRPGMFANVAIQLPREDAVLAAPATAIIHSSYGDSVFVVESGSSDQPNASQRSARQQFVRLGETRGDFVALLGGVKLGEELVTAGAFKLRNGASVSVNNVVKPATSLDPQPENR